MSKRLTRKDKQELSKKGICWKCKGKLDNKRQVVCTTCENKVDELK